MSPSQEEADRVLEQKESEEKERLSDVNYIVDNETGRKPVLKSRRDPMSIHVRISIHDRTNW